MKHYIYETAQLINTDSYLKTVPNLFEENTFIKTKVNYARDQIVAEMVFELNRKEKIHYYDFEYFPLGYQFDDGTTRYTFPRAEILVSPYYTPLVEDNPIEINNLTLTWTNTYEPNEHSSMENIPLSDQDLWEVGGYSSSSFSKTTNTKQLRLKEVISKNAISGTVIKFSAILSNESSTGQGYIRVQNTDNTFTNKTFTNFDNVVLTTSKDIQLIGVLIKHSASVDIDTTELESASLQIDYRNLYKVTFNITLNDITTTKDYFLNSAPNLYAYKQVSADGTVYVVLAQGEIILDKFIIDDTGIIGCDNVIYQLRDKNVNINNKPIYENTSDS